MAIMATIVATMLKDTFFEKENTKIMYGKRHKKVLTKRRNRD